MASASGKESPGTATIMLTFDQPLRTMPFFVNVSVKVQLFLVLMAGIFTQSANAQIDEEDRTLFTMGVTATTGSADPSGTGFLYWNRVNAPWENTNYTVIWAGPYLEGALVFPNLIAPGTSLGMQLGGLGYFANFTPEFVNGAPLRNEELNGFSGWGKLWVNHEFGKYTSYEIPLNLRISYESEYTNYSASNNLRPGYVRPSNPVLNAVETKLQFGGAIPKVRKQQGLYARIRHIYGHQSNWNDFGPGGLYKAESDFNKLIGAAGIFAPLIKDQTFGLQFTAAQGWRLDRSTMYQLGGALVRGEESTRIVGYYTNEFLAEDYYLMNFSYEIPVTEWQDIAVHFYYDYALFRRSDDRAVGWQDVNGVGAGVSFRGPWDTDVLLQWGFALDAVRQDDNGRNEIAIQVGKIF